jgi:glycine/D-amino acid oxidase-like deaminating enzyme
MAVPKATKYAIIGAGIHGLSTAFHLAQSLKVAGKGSGSDILVVDKTAVAAGASGIACGVVRNNYFQPAMRELMAHSVDVWESDPKAYSYHPVGYMQISPECMHDDVASIYQQQKAIGYESLFIEGAEDSAKYMRSLFDDWQAKGITSVLHEKRGGYANNRASMHGLAAKAENEGVRILSGVEVLDFEFGSNSGAITAINTNQGRIACETVVVGVGPWVNNIWNLLELPKRISVKDLRGKVHEDVPMWKFWCLEEGTLGVDPDMHKTNDGRRAGRRLALQSRPGCRPSGGRSLWPRVARVRGRRRLHRDVVLGARALSEAFRGQDAALPAGRKLRRARLLHAG